MANTPRVAGVTKVTLDGEAFRVKGSVEIVYSDVKREAVVGLDGFHGYKEEPKACSIKLDLTVGPELSLSRLKTVTNSTVVCEGPTGATFVLANAVFDGDGAYDPGEGKLSAMLFGSSIRELAAR